MAEQTYQRVDLAREQLEVALRLFLQDQSYISALTLAGAAEEILGKALTHSGKEHALDKWFAPISQTHEILERTQLKKKTFYDEKNRVRNSVKHMRTAADATVTANFEDEACWMIVRAVANYEDLGFARTQHMSDFSEWFYQNVVGV